MPGNLVVTSRTSNGHPCTIKVVRPSVAVEIDPATPCEEFSGTDTSGSLSPGYISPTTDPLLSSMEFLSSGDEDPSESWNPFLYSLQMKAPKAKCVECHLQSAQALDINLIRQFGKGFHGMIAKAEALETLRDLPDGSYLVRETASRKFILSFMFEGRMLNNTLVFDGECHCVGNKRFTNLQDLVDDTLINQVMLHRQEEVSQCICQGREEQRRCTWNRRGKRRKVLRRNRGRSALTSHGSSSSLSDELETADESLSNASSLVSLESSPPPQEIQESPLLQSSLDQQFRLRRKQVTRRRPQLTTSTSKSLIDVDPMRKHLSTMPLLGQDGSAGVTTSNLATTGLEDKRKVSTLPLLHSVPSPTNMKQHNFAAHTYRGPTWCDVCHHFLWGLVQQGMQCQDCGVNAHKQCMEACSSIHCRPNRKMIKRVFGVDLTTLVMMEGSSVPFFLQQGLMEIERRDMCTEGLYRVSGQTRNVAHLKEDVDEGEAVHFSSYDDIHTLTGAVKLFLRELPIPLISFGAYEPVIEQIPAAGNQPVDIGALKQVLRDWLPAAHYQTLQFLVHHLNNIQLLQESNKMTSSNLAVVFAPTMMRSADNDLSFMKDLPQQTKLVETLISNSDAIFSD